ncbi:phage major capsid protein [Microvirga massiliensis]|uniref:phage major capsid protein n=1 Tax=Microvirga massiliensis TaxID=1033741 RepID=UPI00062BBBD1|nr:phage major capsid protein [Microvirga massiliensis]
MSELEKLRAQLREKYGALAGIQSKAFADEATQEDLDAFETALKEIEAIEKKVSLLEKAEELEAKASRPANEPAGEQRTVLHAQPKEIRGEMALSLTAAAIIKGKADGKHPLKVLEDEGYGQFAGELKQDPKAKAVNTLVSAEGGILVPQAQVGGIIPLLRMQSTFLAAGPTRVQFVNGQYKVGRGATGATAAYVAEGALKPVSTPTFDAIDMRAKKLAGIVPLTNEARMWTIGNIEEYVREDLRSALALTLDLNGWLGTGAGASPLGILNKAGVQIITPTFADPLNPTLAELDALATAMILRMTTANIFASNRWRWVMSYRTAMRLADVRVGEGSDGDFAFPTMQGIGSGNAVTWKGFPVVVTAQLPTNGGATTDETTLALVDFTHVLFGEEEGITMKMSDQATLDPDGTGENLIHLWQQNMFAILAESMHDFGLRFAKAVVKATIRF